MKIVLAAVGSPRGSSLEPAIRDFEERAGRYFRLEVVEVPPGRGRPERAMRQEGRELLRKIPPDLQRVALTRRGGATSSRGLAAYLDRMSTYGRPGAAFLLGGAHGLSREVLDSADRRLSLAPLTLPHELARLVLTEQIYRAGTILRGEPYHKESRTGG